MLLSDHEASWGCKSAPEIASIGGRDGSILVLPVGSIEQHGNHLPVATDSILVSEIAHLGAERVMDDVPIVVAPTVWSGYSPHHLSFGGTLSLEYDHLMDVLEDIAKTGVQNGFDAVLLLNGHGGNKSAVGGAVNTIGTAHPSVEITGLTYFDLADSFIDEIRDSKSGGMAHAGEFETSLMLHLREDLVDQNREAEYFDRSYDLAGDDLVEGGPLSIYRPFEEYTESGAIGDPDLASAEKGTEIYTRLGDELETLLRSIHEQNY